jgi:hypothetical protein
MLNKLPTVLFADTLLQFFNLSEVSELRSLNCAIKEIINMNRQFIFTKCFHVPPHGVQEFLNSSRSQVQVCTFKEGKKHGEERHFWRGFDPLNIQRKLMQVTIFKDGQKHGDEKHFSIWLFGMKDLQYKLERPLSLRDNRTE